jgi:hypothetical protein
MKCNILNNILPTLPLDLSPTSYRVLNKLAQGLQPLRAGVAGAQQVAASHLHELPTRDGGTWDVHLLGALLPDGAGRSLNSVILRLIGCWMPA